MISIIGGSGFIGSNFAKYFKDKDIKFKIIDINSSQSRLHWNFGDIRKFETLNNVLEGDTILHLAAEHKDNVKPSSLYYQTNLDGAKNICKAAEKKSINKIIFFSSVAIYKSKKTKNHYGQSKIQAEKVFLNWFRKDPSNRKLIIIRPTAVVGDGNIGNLNNLRKFAQKSFFFLPYSGDNRKSICTVGNLVEFTHACLQSNDKFIISNYVDKPDLSVKEIINIIENKYKKKILKLNSNDKMIFRLVIFLNYITCNKITILKRFQQLMTPTAFQGYKGNINFIPKENLKYKLTNFL